MHLNNASVITDARPKKGLLLGGFWLAGWLPACLPAWLMQTNTNERSNMKRKKKAVADHSIIKDRFYVPAITHY